MIAGALALATLLLYGWRLDFAPMHLHYDEIFFGLQGHAIRTTGHDLNGLRLPVYFQLESTMNWYQPMAVYWTALVLFFAPLSDWAIRLPTVLVGVANVVLTFYLARALFEGVGWAVVAAVALMLTPAHFIHSRVAMDYVYPLPFLLGWTWGMVLYLQGRAPRHLFVATSCLGIGFFSYIAGTALTPMYLASTVAVLLVRADGRRAPIAIAGFAWPLLAATLFIALYPDVVPDLMRKYGLSSTVSAGLDPLQRLRNLLTADVVSDALNRYWTFFSPGYLFFTGGSNLTNSTRTAGVLLPPIALLLAAGIVNAAVARRPGQWLLLFGFFSAAIPAAMLAEPFTIDRELAKVPFAILLATGGARWLWSVPVERAWSTPARNAAIAIAIATVGYSAIALVSRGRWPSSAPLLIVAAVAIFVIGREVDRRRAWSPVVAALLVSLPLLFVPFVADYFDGYRLRSSGWFGGNIRGAIEDLMQRERSPEVPEIHLSTDIPYIRSYWTFYQHVHHREDLAAKTKTFEGRSLEISHIPPGSLVLAAGNDPVVNAIAASGQLTPLAAISDRDDDSDPAQFVIFRR